MSDQEPQASGQIDDAKIASPLSECLLPKTLAKEIEEATGVTFYFATPYHSWERVSNENANGLIRQYVPKRTSMRQLTQRRCGAIALRLNNRPRKRHRYFSPIEVLALYTTN